MHDALREDPEHADEAREQDRRLQQPDAEVGGELGQGLRVGLDALVGVDADLAGAADARRALARHPVADQVLRRELAQPDPDQLVDAGLRDVEHEQDAGDDEEDAELVEESGEVAPLDRVVERLVPGVEPHLHRRGRRR